jgi:hypothetical protein
MEEWLCFPSADFGGIVDTDVVITRAIYTPLL